MQIQILKEQIVYLLYVLELLLVFFFFLICLLTLLAPIPFFVSLWRKRNQYLNYIILFFRSIWFEQLWNECFKRRLSVNSGTSILMNINQGQNQIWKTFLFNAVNLSFYFYFILFFHSQVFHLIFLCDTVS